MSSRIICCLSLTLAAMNLAMASPTSVIERKGDAWVLDTGVVRKVVQLEAGRLSLASFRNEASGREYVTASQLSPKFRLSVDGAVITGTTDGWTLVSDQVRELTQGQWQLDLKIRREAIELEKHYVAYAGTPVIREWVTIANVGAKASKSVNCHIETVSAAAGDLIRFVAHRTRKDSPDPIRWDPIIVLSESADKK